MALKPVYASGAAFQTENNKGKLYVTDQGVVENLNAAMLGGASRAAFVEQGPTKGITQNDKTLTMSGETINLDTASQIKIGNVIIKSSDNGNGILIGV